MPPISSSLPSRLDTQHGVRRFAGVLDLHQAYDSPLQQVLVRLLLLNGASEASAFPISPFPLTLTKPLRLQAYPVHKVLCAAGGVFVIPPLSPAEAAFLLSVRHEANYDVKTRIRETSLQMLQRWGLLPRE